MKVFIGNVVWHDVDAEHAWAMQQFALLMAVKGITWIDGTSLGDSLLSRSRAIVASNFLRSDADVLLTIDSDILFDPQDALRLCEQAMEVGMVGGVYVTRADNPRPCLVLPPEVVFADGQPLVEVPWLSTGFMAVGRKVVEDMSARLLMHYCAQDSPEPWYPFYDPFDIPDPKAGRLPLSEDWAFCERAKADGHTCWIDPTIRLGHKASIALTLEDLTRPPRAEPQPLMVQTNPDGSFATFVQAAAPVEA